MGAGLPVVSFSCPCGPKDIITEGVDGFLVEPNNVNLLAERLCMLMGDESLRKRMGENSAKKVSFYSQRVIMDSWIKLFEEL
jgi:glycosyltransferase involved in cell wall biosynthesis